MALIENSKGRSVGSGYERLFGNNQLGFLFSRVQATIITSGTELEKIIINLSPQIDDLDKFLDNNSKTQGVYLISKKVIKKSKLKSKLEPDLVILKIDSNSRHCYIIELKDGDSFDTKKSDGEKDLLIKFQNSISSKLAYTSSIHFCCFNQNDKKKIVSGFKNKITEEMAMTGEELCAILEINFQDILKSRAVDQQQNLKYFVDELLKIDVIKKYIKIQTN